MKQAHTLNEVSQVPLIPTIIGPFDLHQNIPFLPPPTPYPMQSDNTLLKLKPVVVYVHFL